MFTLLHRIRPTGGPLSGFTESKNLAFEFPVLVALEIIPVILIRPPGTEITLLNLNVRLVDRKNMVYAGVEQIAVVRDQDETLLGRQVIANGFSRVDIEAIGRLVQKKESMRRQKKRGEEHLRPLPLGKGIKRPLQGLLGNIEQGDLPFDLPFHTLGANIRHHIIGPPTHVRDLVREILELIGRPDTAGILELTQKQAKKRRLAPAVSPDEAEFPIAVDLKAYILENIPVTPVIGEGQVVYADT